MIYIIVIISLIIIFFALYLSKGKSLFNEVKPLKDIFAITDPHDFAQEIGFYYIGIKFEKLNHIEKIPALIWELESEINNGGFNQYFVNSSGDHSQLTFQILEKIGALKTKDILYKAFAFFPDHNPYENREKRWEQMEDWTEETEEKLNNLDDEFYKYEENIHKLLYDYCIAHKDEFRVLTK